MSTAHYSRPHGTGLRLKCLPFNLAGGQVQGVWRVPSLALGGCVGAGAPQAVDASVFSFLSGRFSRTKWVPCVPDFEEMLLNGPSTGLKSSFKTCTVWLELVFFQICKLLVGGGLPAVRDLPYVKISNYQHLPAFMTTSDFPLH